MADEIVVDNGNNGQDNQENVSEKGKGNDSDDKIEVVEVTVVEDSKDKSEASPETQEPKQELAVYEHIKTETFADYVYAVETLTAKTITRAGCLEDTKKYRDIFNFWLSGLVPAYIPKAPAVITYDHQSLRGFYALVGLKQYAETLGLGHLAIPVLFRLFYVAKDTLTMQGYLVLFLISKIGAKLEVIKDYEEVWKDGADQTKNLPINKTRVTEVRVTTKDGTVYQTSYSLETAKVAKIDTKGQWIPYPSNMMYWKALIKLHNICPDLATGLYGADELDNTLGYDSNGAVIR